MNKKEIRSYSEWNAINDFKILLKDMEPMVKDPKFLWNGRDLSNFNLRPREIWGNWLLCVVFQHLYGKESITFAEDFDGDGLLLSKKSNEYISVEHVSAMTIPNKKKNIKGESAIIEVINKKIKKGSEYASGKILVVFFDGIGEWYRNKVRETINNSEHNFKDIYAIGLMDASSDYTYSVTHFKEDYSVSFKVKINADFTDWTVNLI